MLRTQKRFGITSAVLTAAFIVLAASSDVLATRAATTIRPALPPPGEAPAGSPVARHGRLTVNDATQRIVGEDGQPVVLRGMSFFHSASSTDGSPWYNEDVVAWLAFDWKATVVRPAMSFDSTRCAHNGTFGGPGGPGWAHPDGKGNWNLAKNVIDAAIARGLYVVMDLHSYRAHNYTESAMAFFEMVVDEYGAYPNMIYEIYNEPNTGNHSGCSGGQSSGGGGTWNPTVRDFSNRVINAIRARETLRGVQPNIIIIGNPGWSSQPNAGSNTDITNRTQTVWTSHFYACSHGPTSNHWSNIPAAMNMGRTVFVTEFGHCDASGSAPVCLSATETWLNQLEERGISWVNWAVTNKACRNDSPFNPTTGQCQSGQREAAAIFHPTVSSASAATWTTTNTPMLNDQGGGAEWIRTRMRTANTSYFPATSWAVSTSVYPEGSGTVSGGGASLAYGATVNITAAPAAGWEFSHWSGDAVGDNPAIPTARVRGLALNAIANFWRRNAVANGHFSVNTLRPLPATTQAWTVGTSGTGAGNIAVVDGELRVNVTNPGTTVNDVRVQQNPIDTLLAGRRYELTFNARAQSPRNILVTIVRTGRPADLSQTVQLSGTMTDYKIAFDAPTAIGGATLRFNMGGSDVTWFLDNVRIDDVGEASGAGVVCTGTCVEGEDPPIISVRHSANNGAMQFRTALRGRQLNFSGVNGNRVDVSLIDMRGRVVTSQSIMATGNRAVMSLDRLPAGVYNVQVKVDGRTISRNERVIVR